MADARGNAIADNKDDRIKLKVVGLVCISIILCQDGLSRAIVLPAKRIALDRGPLPSEARHVTGTSEECFRRARWGSRHCAVLLLQEPPRGRHGHTEVVATDRR